MVQKTPIERRSRWMRLKKYMVDLVNLMDATPEEIAAQRLVRLEHRLNALESQKLVR